MADISISTGAAVQPVFPDSAEIFPFVPAVAFTQGQAVAFNSSGKGILADSNLTSSSGVAQQFRGLALEKGGTRQGVSLLKRGHVAGFDLSALAYGAKVYLSDTAGAIADTPSATKSVVIGQVVPMSDSDATKILYVDATLGWTTGYGRDATAATLQAALEALSSIGTGNVFVTGAAGGPYLVTFQAALGLQAIAIMTGSGASLTGGSGTVTMAHVISGY
jgi:hypothetical protein